MADVSYSELVTGLSELSHPDEIDVSRDFAVKPFLHAWSIVDSAYRLYGLVKAFPNLDKKNQAPEYRIYEAKIVAVRELRNAIQHMPDDIRKTAEKNVWGVLTWVKPMPFGGLSCVLVSGATVFNTSYTVINPAGMIVRTPVGHVTLTVADRVVNLTALMDAMSKLISGLEGGLEQAYASSLGRASADLLLSFAFNAAPNAAQPDPIGST